MALKPRMEQMIDFASDFREMVLADRRAKHSRRVNEAQKKQLAKARRRVEEADEGEAAE